MSAEYEKNVYISNTILFNIKMKCLLILGFCKFPSKTCLSKTSKKLLFFMEFSVLFGFAEKIKQTL